MIDPTAEKITIRGEGVALDTLVARRYRGYLPGYVERVLDTNPHLAEKGPLIPVGTVVYLPVPKRDERVGEIEVIRLWE